MVTMVTYDSVTPQCEGFQAVGIATRHKVEGKLGTSVGASDKIKLDVPARRGMECVQGRQVLKEHSMDKYSCV